jgi:hypothetical protein
VGAVTVNVAPPVCPSIVALMRALPTATAVTTPVAETVATPPLLVTQLTGRPGSGSPLAS